MRLARLNMLGVDYEPISPPCADTEELAEQGERIILRHGSPTNPETIIHVAPKGQITAGWVIGMKL